MSSEMNPNDPKNLWQAQEVEKVTITPDEIRFRATRFKRRIWWRNIREYAAGALVLPLFAARLWRAHGWALAPPLLMIAGTICVLFELHRRADSRSLPADAGLRATLDFHLGELERQRDALHSVWKWYLAPFVPGFAATFAAAAVSRGIHTSLIVFVAVLAVVYAVVWRMNESAARKLEREIQKLRGMAASDE
jgi:hypothetical protein